MGHFKEGGGETIATLTGKQDHLEEPSKIYTGNRKDRKNSWEYYKFIFLLLIYVFLAADAACLEYSYSQIYMLKYVV